MFCSTFLRWLLSQTIAVATCESIDKHLKKNTAKCWKSPKFRPTAKKGEKNVGLSGLIASLLMDEIPHQFMPSLSH